MQFGNEKNIITIIQNSLSNYENYLMDRKFIFVYYDHVHSAYEYTEVIFKKEHYKHLCGISAENTDVSVYSQLGIEKEVVSAKDFYKLCKKHKLGTKHIICKKDGTTLQKMNILNNLYKLTISSTLYCRIYSIKNALKCDAMIGLDKGNISLALTQTLAGAIPLSSLDFDIKSTGEILFDVHLIACKPISVPGSYKNITMSKVDMNCIPNNIRKLFSID